MKKSRKPRGLDPIKILIYGCGGHGRVVLDVLRTQVGDALEAVFVDDNPELAGRRVDGILVRPRAQLRGLLRSGFAAVIGIGENQARARLYRELKSMGFRLANAVHPSAVVSPLARLGEGVALLPGAIVNTGARVESNACINTAASVDHDVVVGAHAHVFPGARLTGNVCVGCFATIGTGASVLPRVRIGDHAFIGAGAVVLEDIPDHAVAFGVPARVHRYQEPGGEQFLAKAQRLQARRNVRFACS